MTDLVGWLKEAMLGKPEPTSSISFSKQADGRTRVLMRVSNNFKDRHGEIITEEAHKEFESYVVRNTNEYPEFQLWHTPGSRWGQADLVSYDDGFLTVSGLVDVGMGYIAIGLGTQKDLGVSHGFKGWGTGDGLIHWYRMKECSPLPRVEAANLLTSIDVLEKGMNDKKKKFFTDIGVPSAVIDSWDKENKDLDAIAKTAGFEFKDVATEPAPEPPAPEPPAPEPKPEQVEVTLPDGSKAMVATSAVVKQQAPAAQAAAGTTEDMPAWAKELVASNKALKDELELVKASKTVDSWEAAIKNGTGFVASKEGDPPSDTEKKDNGEWLADLLIAGGSH